MHISKRKFNTDFKFYILFPIQLNSLASNAARAEAEAKTDIKEIRHTARNQCFQITSDLF